MKLIGPTFTNTSILSNSVLANTSGGSSKFSLAPVWNTYGIGEGIKYTSRKKGASYVSYSEPLQQ